VTDRRRDPSGANQNPEHDFTLPQDQWQLVVFDAATRFRSILWVGPGRYDTREFDTLAAAIADASNRKGQHGRQPTVAAVAPSGRFIVLDRRDWPWLLERERKRRC